MSVQMTDDIGHVLNLLAQFQVGYEMIVLIYFLRSNLTLLSYYIISLLATFPIKYLMDENEKQEDHRTNFC